MDKVDHSNVKYPSTGQFRNVVSAIRNKTRFVGLDETNEPVYDTTKRCPVVPYIGTIKVHGTNGSLIMFEDQTIYCQSKERLLSFGYDNANFWAYMQGVDKEALFNKVKNIYTASGKQIEYPIIIAGEWAGQGIQKGVAVSEVPKFFMVFGVKVGEAWQPMKEYKDISDHSKRIFNALDFPYFEVNIDFNEPENVQNFLVETTMQVEKQCPVGLQLGSDGIGEGCVWKPLSGELSENSGFWLKVKGEKHSVSKVKKLVTVNTEKLESIKEFVDYAVTDNRVEQAAQEIGLDIKLVGQIIRWVNVDIIKEETDTMLENNLDMKTCGKYIADRVKQIYFKMLEV